MGTTTQTRRAAARLVTALAMVLTTALATTGGLVSTPSPASASLGVPPFDHVVEVFLENESAGVTWESDPGLQAVAASGTYIPNFFGAGHASLDNYEAAFGAVTPTAQGKADCLGMPYGTCIFPSVYPTIAGLLDGAGRSWKVYSEGEAGAPDGHPCLHGPDRSLPDPYQGPGSNGYATRHNPAPWFDSILTKGGSEAYCQAHNPDLTQLAVDEQSPSTMPAFSFIQPDTCHDGHDTSAESGCTFDPEGANAPTGIAAIDAWLPGFIQQLTSRPWWSQGRNVLFLTFDEGASSDTAGCASCADGSAGGRVGAVVISPLVVPGTTSTWSGDHYGFLRTVESAWKLPTLKSVASPTIAAQINDGDPGVTPLTDIWR